MTRFEWTISILTGIAALVAGLTAAILWKQIIGMRIDQRAWISTHRQVDAPNVVINQNLKYATHIANTGKTPAKSVDVWTVTEIVKSDSPPDLEHSHKPFFVFRSYMGDLYPNDSYNAEAVRGYQDKENVPMRDRPVTADEYADVMNGSAYVAVHGAVFYGDVFGGRHKKQFCFWFSYNPNPSIAYNAGTCTAYNTDLDCKRDHPYDCKNPN